MFNCVNGALIWRDRPYSDFLTKNEFKHWHKFVKGTTFKDGETIRIGNDWGVYSLDEVRDIMTEVFPPEPSTRKARHAVIDDTLSTHEGEYCYGCGNTHRYDHNDKCATCVKYDKRGDVVWTRLFLRARMICDRGVMYWLTRPTSDFDSVEDWDEWNNAHANKRIPRRVSMVVEGRTMVKPIEQIIDTYYSKPVT